MQLLRRRSQRKGGAFGDKVVFVLGIRAEYTEAERAAINHYRLGGEVIYNSQAARKHLEAAERHIDGSGRGLLKGLGSIALANMNLNVTMASLQQGHAIECKDLGELLECEDALLTACKNIKGYLEAAATFDGREIVVDLDEQAAA
ncbi:MAG TPA: hypothetical protein VM755_09780 [Stellaceae bacterium]|nr:hypothetical protein [Stellaceae bacterium]